MEIQLRLMKSFFSILRQSKPHAPILHAWSARIKCWEKMCVTSARPPPLSLLRSLYCARSLVLSSSRAPSSFLPPRAPLLLLFSRIVFLPSSPHSFCPPLVSPSRPPSSMAVLLTRWNDLGERPVHVPHPIESFVRSDADETFHHRWLRYSYCFFFHSTTPAVIVFLFIY